MVFLRTIGTSHCLFSLCRLFIKLSRTNCVTIQLTVRASSHEPGWLALPRWLLSPYYMKRASPEPQFLYSCFEKGCQKKCTRQFTVFHINFKEWHERPWTYVCEGQRKALKVGSTATVSRTSVLIISHITFRDCRVHSFCDNLSRNSCIHTYYIVTSPKGLFRSNDYITLFIITNYNT